MSYSVYCKACNRNYPYRTDNVPTLKEAKDLKACYENETLSWAIGSEYFIVEMNKSICFTVNGTISEPTKKFDLDTNKNQRMIDVVNDFYKKGFTIILLSCCDEPYEIIEQWLKINKVSYHLMQELPVADIYVNGKHIVYNENKVCNKLIHNILRPFSIWNDRQKNTKSDHFLSKR